jgi:hypothetical protein
MFDFSEFLRKKEEILSDSSGLKSLRQARTRKEFIEAKGNLKKQAGTGINPMSVREQRQRMQMQAAFSNSLEGQRSFFQNLLKKYLGGGAGIWKYEGEDELHVGARPVSQVAGGRQIVNVTGKKTSGWDANDTQMPSAAEIQNISEEDLKKSKMQALMLDCIRNANGGKVKVLFTTANLKSGSAFLRCLHDSSEAYQSGFIMNPTILKRLAPKLSPIQWDARINADFCRAGMQTGAPFVFVTQNVGYTTFLDPETKKPNVVQEALSVPVGAPCQWHWLKLNYPVKPGGNEVKTLLDSGYALDLDVMAAKDSRLNFLDCFGFVLKANGGGGKVAKSFEQNSLHFTQDHLDTLLKFMRELDQAGALPGGM